MPRALLAIESSCDETSAAVVVDGDVVSLTISSQAEHSDWGGVVPELASRAHLKNIVPIVKGAMHKGGIGFKELDAVAVTTEPGLIGSLLVGANVAKGIAAANGIPLIAVNHIEAHVLSIMIENKDVQFPYLGLVVSGGHTLLYDVQGFGNYTILGATRDDAAGEAFDKGAKLLGLGYPGGPLLDRIAAEGNPTAINFPRGLLNDSGYDFSFSGLKTSLRYHLRDHYNSIPPEDKALADICASYQEAIVDVLVAKVLRAAKAMGYLRIAVVGGVSVNSRLRRRLAEVAEKHGLMVYTTQPIYSTDNAAMIGIVGWLKLQNQAFSPLSITARASLAGMKERKQKARKKSPNTALEEK